MFSTEPQPVPFHTPLGTLVQKEIEGFNSVIIDIFYLVWIVQWITHSEFFNERAAFFWMEEAKVLFRSTLLQNGKNQSVNKQ